MGSNAELVADRETGIVVPPGDVEAMAQALVQIASDPHRASLMGRSGREVVERRFSLPGMVAAYEALYDRMRAGQH